MDDTLRLCVFVLIVSLALVVGLMFINSFGLQLPHALLLLCAILGGLIVVLETAQPLREDLWLHASLACGLPLVFVFLGAHTLGGTFSILFALCCAIPAILTGVRARVFTKS